MNARHRSATVSVDVGSRPMTSETPAIRTMVSSIAVRRTLHVADPDGFVVESAPEIPRTRSRRGAG